MAKISGIYIGGRENAAREIFNSGIAFVLSAAPRVSVTYTFDREGWEVEIKQGCSVVVARCKNTLTLEETIIKGFQYCQEGLDMLSVSRKGTFVIVNAENDQHILYKSNENFILRHFSINYLGIGVEASSIEIYRDGEIVPDPPKHELPWNETFRYYRLSQSSHDIFEAYRNLFLGLESMLNTICPKERGEGEVDWLRRALTQVSSRVDFRSILALDNGDPVNYIIRNQYKEIRCKLFHAKDTNMLLPFYTINPSRVSIAYDALIKIWREIAAVYLNVPSGGGTITVAGFKRMMDESFIEGVSIQVTEDPTPFHKLDSETSPKGFPVFDCKDASYQWDDVHKEAIIIGNLEYPDLANISCISRICSFAGRDLMMGSHISGGVDPNGIDLFEAQVCLRLLNTTLPRKLFLN